MVDFKVPVAGPLQDFVQGHYHELFRYGDFIFNVPRNSQAVAFGRYELKESASSDPAVFPLLFTTHVLLNGTPGRVGLEKIEYPWTAGPEFLTTAARVIAEPIDREGHQRGPAIDLATQPALRGLYRLSVFSPRLPPKLPWQDYALVVRTVDGQLLSESVH